MNKKVKKFGGTITNWQTHTLFDDPKIVAKVKERCPNIKTDTIMCFTGTVVEDPTGRWEPGYHMRSSTICHLDTENGIIETFNTIYKIEVDNGNDCFSDLGQGVTRIFY